MTGPARFLALDDWAGRRYYRVEVVSETAKRARVRVMEPAGIRLPGRRYVGCGEIASVPKHALRDAPG